MTGTIGGAGTAGRQDDADLICFSHLRWDLVYQRPQHLLSRAARQRRVVYFEEPLFGSERPRLEQMEVEGVRRIIPHLPTGLAPGLIQSTLRRLLDDLLEQLKFSQFTAWYYTPMALSFSGHLRPALTVYDCMDELSLFRGAPPGLQQFEQQLLRRADVVFTGGSSLFKAKRALHRNVRLFPSSIDREHFRRTASAAQPAETKDLAHPRIGFYGVIDERTDLPLLAQLADCRPDWQFILVGPVVKIEPEDLPQRPNLHWPGRRDYKELPNWLAAFDVAMMPFALNDSTRFISPTKTLEYLAAGRRVVSTAIEDVREPYGRLGVVSIAADAAEFIRLCEEALAEGTPSGWQEQVDRILSATSWDLTWQRMQDCLRLPLEAALPG